MKTEKQLWKRSRQLILAAGALLVGSAVMSSCTDKYDLDEKSPSGWGSSIYGWLDESGNFTNTVRLIDDLGYREVLAKTGSKTLFAANDEAFDRFYKNNAWGVSNYDQLSLAQKKLLLYGSMIDNSIQINSLSTIEGTPLREGQCMRRFTALSAYDTVAVLKPEQMPDNKYWKRHRESGKEMVIMEDETAVPMLLFLQAQMANNRITNEDYNFLFNKTVSRQDGDASVNGIKVVEQNVRCGNGFIHVTSDVVTPLPNMAELIARKPQCSIFYKLMERFCAPYPDPDRVTREQTMEYNRIYNKDVDTLYFKRFINDKRGVETTKTPDGAWIIKEAGDDGPAIHLPCLRFNPEWNAYYSASNKNPSEGNVAEQRDMAVIMVPTNDAMNEYWNGIGKPLSENYASWDEVDDKVIVELLNLNMLSSFVSSVPSKFEGVLNDANDPMGLTTNDVDSVWMACNGAVYQTNKVFSPTSYVCVSFPALVDKSMRIINWAIEQCKYNNYMKALGTTYSFFIPNNKALTEYIDPCSYGKAKLQQLSFRWDEATGVSAVIYEYDPVLGTRDSIGVTTDHTRLVQCLRDILDTHIVIGNVWDGQHTYYRTKNGSGIRVTNATNEATMTVEGSYQMNEGQPIHIARVWDQRKEVTGGNGKSYVLDSEPIMGTRKTVFDQLSAHPKYFQKFLSLLNGTELLETERDMHTGKPEDNKACGGTNISVFNTYHYTIYVPSNEAIQALQDAGKLSSWEKIDALRDAGNYEQASKDSVKILEFLKYHIQDNALYLGAENESGDFETSLINSATSRFYMLHSQLNDNTIEVKDETGTVHRVTKQTYIDDDNLEKELFNIQAREYQYYGRSRTDATTLYTTSSAVIHLIDSPLSNGKW